jgi:hypothetical protein
MFFLIAIFAAVFYFVVHSVLSRPTQYISVSRGNAVVKIEDGDSKITDPGEIIAFMKVYRLYDEPVMVK